VGILLLQNGAFAGLLLPVGCALLCRRSRSPRFGLWLFLAVLVTRALYAAVIETPVISDFQVLLTSARQWAQGNMAFSDNIYYKLWGYQLPFTGWEAILVSLWDSELFLRVMNAPFMAGCSLLIYLLGRIHWGETAARTAAGLYTGLVFPLMMASVLTNQHVGAFFLLLALWLLTEPALQGLRFWRWPLAGLSAALGHAARSEGVLLLIALGAFGVFWLLQNRAGLLPRLKRGLPRALAFVLVYAVVLSGIGAFMNLSGASINGTGIDNTNPLWKFVVGLNHETMGSYSQEDATAMFTIAKANGGGCEELDELELELIRQRLSASPRDFLRLFANKLWRLFARSEPYWSLGHWDLTRPILRDVSYGDVYDFVSEYDPASRLPVYLLALLGVWHTVRRGKPEELSALIPAFTVFAALCVFLLIEVQGRYLYLPLTMLAVTAAGGIHALEEHFRAK